MGSGQISGGRRQGPAGCCRSLRVPQWSARTPGPQHPLEPSQLSPRPSSGQPRPACPRQAGAEAASTPPPGGLSQARVSVPLAQISTRSGWKETQGTTSNARAGQGPGENTAEPCHRACILYMPSPALHPANRRHPIDIGWMDGRNDGWALGLPFIEYLLPAGLCMCLLPVS